MALERLDYFRDMLCAREGGTKRERDRLFRRWLEMDSSPHEGFHPGKHVCEA